MPLASNPLIQVTPGLMIWTIFCFLVTLYVLNRFAFDVVGRRSTFELGLSLASYFGTPSSL